MLLSQFVRKTLTRTCHVSNRSTMFSALESNVRLFSSDRFSDFISSDNFGSDKRDNASRRGDRSGYSSGGRGDYSSGDRGGYSRGGRSGYSSGGRGGYSSGGRGGYSSGGRGGYSSGGRDGYNSGGRDGYSSGGRDGYSSGGRGSYSSGSRGGYNSGGRGGRGGSNVGGRERNLQKEADHYFNQVRRGYYPRELNEIVLQRKEKQLFGNSEQNAPSIDYQKYMDSIEVERSGKDHETVSTMNSFEELFENNLIPKFLERNIQLSGYTVPTPVQKHAIPLALAKKDLMVSAQTGSGKTVSFLIPALARDDLLDVEYRFNEKRQCTPRVLILAPTRELAIQINSDAEKLMNRSPFRSVAVFGGTKIREQLDNIAIGVDVMIATPGRLSDLVDRGIVSLEEVNYLVLDEADRMLDMGFEPQIRKIVEESDMISSDDGRQTVMFSATFPRSIQSLARDFLSRDYIWVAIGRVGITAEGITQHIMQVNHKEKPQQLVEVLSKDDDKTLVFVEQKKTADFLYYFLEQQGYSVAVIHGDLSQNARENSLKQFKAGRAKVLVATDVASRGIDIPNVAHVINYDLPKVIDSYVHRVGRTGRAGKKGKATALFTNNDFGLARQLADSLKESKQTVPEWLHSGGGHNNGGGGGRGQSYQKRSRYNRRY